MIHSIMVLVPWGLGLRVVVYGTLIKKVIGHYFGHSMIRFLRARYAC